MKARYFLFGESAVSAFIDANEQVTDKLKEDLEYHGYGTYAWVDGDDPANLLNEAIGWGDYTEITEQQYNEL